MAEPAANQPAPGCPPPDDSPAARRRAQILESATRLFATHGFRHTDVQWVADDLGIGKGTIYRYFPSKNRLFLDAVDRGMRQLSDHLCNATAHQPDPLNQIRLAIATYLQFFADRPELVELLIQERAEFKDRPKPTYYEYRDATVQQKRDFFNQLIDQQRVRPMDVDVVIQLIDDMLYGTIFTNYFNDHTPSPQQQSDQLIEIIFHGILTDPERQQLSPPDPEP